MIDHPGVIITGSTPWVYDARLLEVYDGDTVTLQVTLVDLDLGFGLRLTQTWPMKIRLAHIQAPELRKPGGKEAREYLLTLIQIGSPLVLRTLKDAADKYGGRYDGELYLTTEQAADPASSINMQMIRAGHAVAWDGTGPKPAGT